MTQRLLASFVLCSCLAFGVASATEACSPAEITAAKTVADVALEACKVAFGKSQLPPGISLDQFCHAAENQQPFIDALLSAKRSIALRNPSPQPDAGP